jgi:diacylglycerol kinase (ATP)
LTKYLGKLEVAVTERPEQVAEHLHRAAARGIDRVIGVGGDGTNHSIVNALLNGEESLPMTFGTVPVGTGVDWARTLRVPYGLEDAARWLADARPRTIDIGRYSNGGGARFFLNVASVGLSGEVDKRVNAQSERHTWTFVKAVVDVLLHYEPQMMTVRVDGGLFYHGRAYLLALANGQYFGKRLWIAPKAEIKDGIFDVLLAAGVSRWRVIFQVLPLLYLGRHTNLDNILYTRGRIVEVVPGRDEVLGLDMDGEPSDIIAPVQFEVLPDALSVFSH